MDITQMVKSKTSDIYKNEVLDALKLSFPGLYEWELREAIDYSIMKRGGDSPAVLDNDYKKVKEKTTLWQVTDYIMSREPIITVSGVMFRKHGSVPNPFVMLIQEFLNKRAEYKGTMFKFPKGSEEFEKYNILQLSEKVSGNAMYGASGNHTAIFYNLNVAQSITMQGRSCIAAAIMLFEATMANNVKFSSLNEVIAFINNVRREPDSMYPDEYIIDSDKVPNVEEVFFKILYSCGFYWVPSEKEMTLVWDILNRCTQHELNKLFYKNNLFWFVDNSVVMNKITQILSTLDTPFIDPNKPPECIKDMMEELYQMIYDWVYYDKQYVDRIDRTENMYRCVSMLTDTDSCFISFDGWYHYILDKTFNIPMKIKEIEIDEKTAEIQKAFEIRYDYDFYKDEVIEMQDYIRPDVISPQVGFRCSIINILASIMGKLAIDYMGKYSDNSHSTTCADGSKRKSFFILKNEFQLKRALITDGKKNYCAYQERQESSIIPRDKALDVKGMTLKKEGTAERTKIALQRILMEQILDNPGEISQVEIVKQLAILEKQIVQSIYNGDKEYFKPERIKASTSYDNPLRISGIKASIVYNELREDGDEPIDLSTRNTVLNIKIDLNKKNVEQLKDSNPNVYRKAVELMKKKEFEKGITGIAILTDKPIPEWVKDYIDYTTIINDNLRQFPCEAVGIDRRDKDAINYTNILKL
jgi:DNA polymerase elongation subunit (family B)